MSGRRSPDICFDTDVDGTKLLIRKFDMPLPKHNIGLYDRMIDPLPERKLEKWKYQHDVPDGKIFTMRVHPDVSPVRNVPQTGQILSPMVSLSTKLPTSVQNIQVVNTPVRKDVIVVAPKDQTSKVLPSVWVSKDQTTKVLPPVVPKNVVTDKITVNNVPESVIADTIKLVDSVNGRKVVYLKTVRDDKIVGKIVSKAINIGTSRVPETRTVNCINSSGIVSAANSSNVNLNETKRVYYGPKTLQNIAEIRSSDSQMGTPISSLRTALTQKLNVSPLDGKLINTVPSNNGVQKNDTVWKQSYPAIVSSTIPTSNIQVSSLTSLNNRELKNIYFPESVTRIAPGKVGYPSVISDVSNSGRETLRVNAVPHPEKRFIIDSSQQKINLTDRNISVVGVELLNSAPNKASSISDSVVRVNDQQTCQENTLKFVPADSTTPFIIKSSVKQNINLTSPTDALLILKADETRKNHPETSINMNQKPSCVVSAESKISSNESDSSFKNAVWNQSPNSSSSRVALPKQNLKYDEMLRRRKIALKFQQDMQRHRSTPRIERTVEIPAKKVKVVDGSSQTSLFSLLEPGRIVEMFLNEDSNDLNITRQTGNKISNSDSSVSFMTEETCVNKRMQDFMITNRSLATDPPLSKRIRLDLNNSDSDGSNDVCHNFMNETSDLTRMDFEDLIPSHICSMEKENHTASTNSKKTYKNNKIREQNNKINTKINNNSERLASIQSTRNNINNINERSNPLDNLAKLNSNKKMLNAVYKDFRGSLAQDEDGNLPIHNAVMDRKVPEVERHCLVLTAMKKSVDQINAMKETPLHLAVLCHDLEIVKLLLKYKAKPDVTDSDGNTALHMAIKWDNNPDILKELLSSIDYNSPVLNISNDEGYSPLHLCALHTKNVEALLLVEKKAEIDLRDRKSGRTALFHAVENSNYEMSRMLVNFGASTTIANFSGQTPLNASEVTLVLERLTAGQERPKFGKQLVAPCHCQSKSDKNENPSVSLNDNYADLIANASIEILVSDNDSDHLNLLNTDFHNR